MCYNIRLILITLFLYTQVYGQGWKELNPPYNQFNSPIQAIISDANGKVYAAGRFKNAAYERIVTCWDGSSWRELGSGNTALHATGDILALAKDGSGNLYAAGAFNNNSGTTAVAKWNGTAWSDLGTGINALNESGFIYAMTVDPAGNVYVAGGFSNEYGSYKVMKWNGTGWAALGKGADTLKANGFIYSLASDSSGNIYAAGHFTDAAGKYYVAKWNGTTWTNLGNLGANDYIQTLAADRNGSVYAGGNFTNASGNTYIAKWNGLTWSELGGGANALNGNARINAVTCNPEGTMVYAGGLFTNGNGNFAVRSWDGVRWTETFYLSNIVTSTNGINALSLDKSGNLYAGGGFINNSGNSYVAKWNGSSIVDLGRTGTNLDANSNGIRMIAAGANGHVYAEGNFLTYFGADYSVAEWDGLGWNPLPSVEPVGGDDILTMVTDAAGNLYAGGRGFQHYVEKWDGKSWSQLGGPGNNLNPIGPIHCLKRDKAGNIYAAGSFEENGFLYGVAKWNGTTWSHFFAGSLGLIEVDSQGHVFTITNHNDTYKIIRVDSTHDSYEGLTANFLNPNGFVNVLSVDNQGNFYAGGTFQDRGSLNSFVYKWDGTSWTQLIIGVDASVNDIAIDSTGKVYASIRWENGLGSLHYYVGWWDGKKWAEVGTGANSLWPTGDIASLDIDADGNVYAAGSFGLTIPHPYVAKYSNAYHLTALPQLSGLVTGYCQEKGLQKLKLLNPPPTEDAGIIITLDTTVLVLATDSTVSFNPNTLSIGQHKLQVKYLYKLETKVLESYFIITAASMPAVTLSSNITTIVNLTDPLILRGVNVAGGGSKPLYTFSKDRLFSILLQNESLTNTVTLSAGSLAVGENRIYVRMRTSDTCYKEQSGTDSITITRSATTGITDIDFPNVTINIYPNPVDNIVYVKGLSTAKAYVLTITSKTGQIVYSAGYKTVQELEVNLSHLQTGIYQISLYDERRKKVIGSVQVLKR